MPIWTVTHTSANQGLHRLQQWSVTVHAVIRKTKNKMVSLRVLRLITFDLLPLTGTCFTWEWWGRVPRSTGRLWWPPPQRNLWPPPRCTSAPQRNLQRDIYTHKPVRIMCRQSNVSLSLRSLSPGFMCAKTVCGAVFIFPFTTVVRYNFIFHMFNLTLVWTSFSSSLGLVLF